MGAVIPQVVTESSASGAQVIDGSLGFSGTDQKLERTPGSAGNQQTWTWSSWVKINPGQNNSVFAVYTGASDRLHLRIGSSYAILAQNTGSWDFDIRSNAKFRDNEWYHFVCVADFTNSTQNDRAILYVNGERLTLGTNTLPSNTTTNTIVNATKAHYIGESYSGTDFDGRMSQVYLIDGQALGPENFGFTDPLTNTWRPKKYTGSLRSGEGSGDQATNAEYTNNMLGFYFNGDPGSGSASYPFQHLFLSRVTETGTTDWGDSVTFGSSTGTDFSIGDTIMWAYDEDAAKLWLGRNGTWYASGNPATGANATMSGFPTDRLLLKTLYYEDSGVANNSDLYLTKVVEGSKSYSIPSGFEYWSGMNQNWAQSGGANSSTTRPDYIPQRITGKVYFETTVNWTGTGAWADFRIFGLSSDGNSNTNSFYLPMDGNSSIGQDKSGNGNDWTPVNSVASVALDKATGARPILNTTPGGTHAGVGVFGSKEGFYETVSSSSGGGNPYIFDTRGTQPTLSFIRGATYVFDYSSATSHPLRFATAADAAGSTEYTDGTSISGNVISFTVPHNAPDTLYYYCTNHTGMGNSISVTTDETKADPYAWKCVLAVPFAQGNATANDVSDLINCTTSAKSFTKVGDPVTNTSSNFYSSSIDFDASGDYYYSGSSSDFAFGTGDFTVELWINSDLLDSSNAQRGFLQISSSSTGLESNYTAGLAIYEGGSAGTINTAGITDTNIPSSGRLLKGGVWNHLALVREGTSARLYANGFLAASGTDSKDITGTYLAIGGYYNTSYLYDGKLQDVRIYKGVAKYTSEFIPASTNPDILPDTPSGVSGGSKLAEITDGAVAFDGTSGTSMNIANSSDFSFGSGDWTVECYHYSFKAPGSGTNSLIGMWNSGSNRRTWLLNLYNDYFRGYFSIDGAAGGSIYQVGDSTVKVGSDRWYHVALVRNGNNLYLFQDGKLIDTQDVTGQSVYNNTTDDLYIGSGHAGTVNNTNGYISNLRVVKGTALYTSDFTPPTRELTNVTNTTLLCCQSNTSTTEAAVSPSSLTANGDIGASNFNPFNTDINTVRGQESGYATLNRVSVGDNGGESKVQDGNLTAYWNGQSSTHGGAGDTYGGATSTIGMSSGKWYWEIDVTEDSANNVCMTGVQLSSQAISDTYGSTTDGSWTWYRQTARHNNATTATTLNAVGNRLTMIAVDMDNGYLWFGQDGIWENGSPTNGSSTAVYTNLKTFDTSRQTVYATTGSAGQGAIWHARYNFGQKPFKFPPPDGFQPLNTANAKPETVIARPDQYVGVTTFVGNGGTKNVNTGFKPDMVWIKNRDTARNHCMFDTVCGVLNRTLPNTTDEEYTVANTLTSFNSDGFTLGSNNESNSDTDDHVVWSWKAGGGTGITTSFWKDDVEYSSAAAAGVDGGTITPYGASIGTKTGFSIIGYTGTNSNDSVPHGLNSAPQFILVKCRDSAQPWLVGHSSAGFTKYLWLNDLIAATSLSTVWQNTAPTSSVFTIGATGGVNLDNTKYVAYCWHNVPGLQKFGSYEGNEVADGPYVELGFKPALLLLKSADATGGWAIIDGTRDPINPANALLQADKTTIDTESSVHVVDILSNGFKIRGTGGTDPRINPASTVLYAAWAEAPTFNLYGGQSNAR